MWYIDASFKDMYFIARYFRENKIVSGELYNVFSVLLAPLNIHQSLPVATWFSSRVFFPELPDVKNLDSHPII
jgi:hypothetical protein